MSLEEKILAKGFKYVDIEYPNDECSEYYTRVWFDFKWNKSGKVCQGKQEIEGNTEEEILNNVNKFINEACNWKDWTIILKIKPKK